jgi:hypothetical protein
MNDDDMLAATRSSLTNVRDSLTDVHMARPPEAIMARARGRRLRRTLPGVAAGGLALGLGLALSLPGGSPAAPGGSAAGPGGAQAASGGSQASAVVHVNLAAWSVNTTAAGQVNVTIRDLRDREGLARTLAQAGVPVNLTSGRVCASDYQLDRQLPRVVNKLPGNSDLVLTINPKAMPAGAELVIGIGTLRQGSRHWLAAAFGLTRKGVPLNCPGKPGK